MQYKVNDTQAETIPGNESIDTNTVYLSRTAEDNNCEVGKFVFEGTDAETQAVGIKEGATEENILGVVKRCPFQSGYQNGGKILKGNNLTIINKGTVAVKTSTEAKVGDDVFIDNKTGEILTKPIPKLSVEQYEVIQPNFFKKIIYSEDKNIFVGIGSDIIAYSEDGKTFNNVEPFEEMSYYDIIYANGLFVVLCEERKTSNFAIKWSEDGKTFNNCTIPDPNLYCNSITYGKDIFVAIGNSKALWSADGKTFQYGNNPVPTASKMIYYANNIFVTVGVGDVSWSEDGKTFTKGTLQRSGIYNKIYYAHNTFILIGLVYLSYSTDGKNFKTSNAPSKFYNDITYANGVFVVVGNYFMGYSTDGINFTECTEYPKGYNYESIIFERGLFIAVGSNIIAYSEDGKTFKKVNKIPEGNYKSITYGNNLFVAGGDTVAYLENYEGGLAFVKGTHIDNDIIYKIIYANNTHLAMGLGTLYYSMNGITFLKSDTGEYSGVFNGLAYGNGVFVATGNNEIQYSEDNCVTFKKAVFPENREYFNIKYIEGLFIAVGIECAAYSTDGKTFTYAVIPQGIYKKIAVKEEQGSKTIVAVGYLGNEGKIAYSTNGISYDAGTIPNGYYIDIVYDNGVFVALGEDIICYSTDGINFTECTEYPTGKFNAIIYANNNFIAVGENIAAYSRDGISFAETELIGDYRALANGDGIVIAVGENTAAYTYNGTNYTNINLSEKENFYCVTYGGGADAKFVAGGLNIISYSDTKHNLDFTEGTINLPVNGYNTLLCDNNNCVALGNNVYCYLNNYFEEKFFEYHIMYGNYISAAYGNNITVAAGDKGLMWSDFQNNFTNCESPKGNYNSVTYDNNLFVAVGENIAAWSEDGETFTEGTIPEGNYTSITYGNGLFVAIGVNIIAYSEDGKTFTKCASYSEGTYNSITYGNGVFVAVGLQNVIVSNDGKTFTDATHMQDIEINKVTFCNGLFFIIGNMYIQYSETGTDFTSITLAYSEKHKAITYGDGLFIIVGSNGLIAYSDSGKSFTKVIDESIKNINFVDVKYYNGNFIAVGENNLKAVFSIKKESNNYLNTGFKVLTNGEPDETIKIYKQ